MFRIFVAIGMAVLPTAALAQEKTAAVDTNQTNAKEKAASGRQNFGGLDFGIGVSMSYDLGNNDRVSDAVITNNIVRVTRTENIRARIVLESHYFATPTFSSTRRVREEAFCASFRGNPVQYDNCMSAQKNFGIGPFVALQPGGEKVIDAIGLGVMVGLRRGADRASSFNLGVGIFYDVDTRILGNGFVEDKPPPAGETEVRFRRQSQSGLLFISSYSF
ncbi:hypothetical protein ASE57_13580 [Sphingomonas sp. Leaf11]|nr:hypothetical protein ASE57_13580 [Sphingomonas sp. Leaf11]